MNYVEALRILDLPDNFFQLAMFEVVELLEKLSPKEYPEARKVTLELLQNMDLGEEDEPTQLFLELEHQPADVMEALLPQIEKYLQREDSLPKLAGEYKKLLNVPIDDASDLIHKLYEDYLIDILKRDAFNDSDSWHLIYLLKGRVDSELYKVAKSKLIHLIRSRLDLEELVGVWASLDEIRTCANLRSEIEVEISKAIESLSPEVLLEGMSEHGEGYFFTKAFRRSLESEDLYLDVLRLWDQATKFLEARPMIEERLSEIAKENATTSLPTAKIMALANATPRFLGARDILMDLVLEKANERNENIPDSFDFSRVTKNSKEVAVALLLRDIHLA